MSEIASADMSAISTNEEEEPQSSPEFNGPLASIDTIDDLQFYARPHTMLLKQYSKGYKQYFSKTMDKARYFFNLYTYVDDARNPLATFKEIQSTTKVALSEWKRHTKPLKSLANHNLFALPDFSKGFATSVKTTLTKIVYDNKLKFNYDFNLLIWDIETVATNSDFPTHDNPTAYVTCIQFYHKHEFNIYTLEQYRGQFTEPENTSFAYFKHPAQMCQAFYKYLETLNTQTLIIAFNGNSDTLGTETNIDPETETKTTTEEHIKMFSREVYGFDLPFILSRAGFLGQLNTINTEYKAGGHFNFKQTIRIETLKACIFVDA